MNPKKTQIKNRPRVVLNLNITQAVDLRRMMEYCAGKVDTTKGSYYGELAEKISKRLTKTLNKHEKQEEQNEGRIMP